MKKFLKAIPVITFLGSVVAAVITLLFPENRKTLRENWRDHLAQAQTAAREASQAKRQELEAELKRMDER